MASTAAVALTPIRLAALSAKPAPAGASGRIEDNAERPFGPSPFRRMNLISLRGDHVVATIDGSIAEYAIGHLPLSVRSLIKAPGVISASLADGQKRTMLGIASDRAINDLHDEDPWICQVSLAVIRAYAPDPQATLRAYLACAPLVARLEGREVTATGDPIVYEADKRRLTVEWRGRDWTLLRDRIEISSIVPATVCVASVGHPVLDLLEHPMFEGTDAVITGIKPGEWGTEIHFQTTPLRVRTLDEAPRRRP